MSMRSKYDVELRKGWQMLHDTTIKMCNCANCNIELLGLEMRGYLDKDASRRSTSGKS